MPAVPDREGGAQGTSASPRSRRKNASNLTTSTQTKALAASEEAVVPMPLPSRHPQQETDRHSTLSVFISSLCGVLAAAIICACLQYCLQFGSVRYNNADLDARIQSYVDTAVVRALRDSVGRRDFALHANGGRILPELTTSTQDPQSPKSPPRNTRNSPDVALVDDLRVGSCWCIPGGTGQLGLRLSDIIYPTHVSIDHIPVEIAADAGTAPRRMVLWGAIDGAANQMRHRSIRSGYTLPSPTGVDRPPITHGHVYLPLASFEYDIYAPSHTQTFDIDEVIRASFMDFGVMVLQIIDNWGGNETCLYRVRVHGRPVPEVVVAK